MSKLTYKNIYSLVNELITKRISFDSSSKYSGTNQTNRPSISLSSRDVDISVADLIKSVQDVLSASLESRVIEGLNVTATDPISNKVNISAGNGTAAGVLYSLETATTITIPFDSTTEVFYINLYLDRILIDKNEDSSKLTVAKIVVPRPGITNRIKDNKEDNYEWDAYIVNFRSYLLYGDAYGKLEEDSLEFLRDNIGKVLSENLIGNIRLSENLKILNTQGTLEINSKEIKIFDENSNVLSKFNRYGTFFYDTDGIELARFSNVDARIGNILITTSTLESGDFTSGNLGKGFQIKDTGDAEFNSVLVRGLIKTSVFEKTSISSIGGNFVVLDSDTLDDNMGASD